MNRFGDFEYGLVMKEESAKGLARRAKAGDAQAQFELGNFYHNGVGSTQNYTRALYWYQKASAQKHEGAQRMLTQAQRLIGTEYITGNTLKKMTEDERRYAEGLQKRKIIEIEGDDNGMEKKRKVRI